MLTTKITRTSRRHETVTGATLLFCEKYNNIKVPFKHRQVIKRLAENNNIMLLRQDKGKGVVIMDKGKHTEKSIEFKSV